MPIKKHDIIFDSFKYIYIIVSLAILTVLYEKNHTISFTDVIKRSLFIIIAIIIWYIIFDEYLNNMKKKSLNTYD